MNFQDTEWAELDAANNAVFDCCYRCADHLARLRPSMAREEAMQAYKNKTLEKGQSQPFNVIVDESLVVLEDIEKTRSLGPFNPQSSVNRERAYGAITYQDLEWWTQVNSTG